MKFKVGKIYKLTNHRRFSDGSWAAGKTGDIVIITDEDFDSYHYKGINSIDEWYVYKKYADLFFEELTEEDKVELL